MHGGDWQPDAIEESTIDALKLRNYIPLKRAFLMDEDVFRGWEDDPLTLHDEFAWHNLASLHDLAVATEAIERLKGNAWRRWGLFTGALPCLPSDPAACETACRGAVHGAFAAMFAALDNAGRQAAILPRRPQPLNKEARQNHKYSRLVCSVESGLLSMPNLNRVLAEDKAPLAEMRGYRNVCAHSLSAMLYWEGPRLRLPSRAWVEDYTWLARRLFHLPDEQPTQPVDLYDAEVDAPGQLHRYLKSCCNVLDAAWRDMADSLAT